MNSQGEGTTVSSYSPHIRKNKSKGGEEKVLDLSFVALFSKSLQCED